VGIFVGSIPTNGPCGYIMDWKNDAERKKIKHS